MFNQFTELFQTSLKPIDKLVQLNLATANTILHQQGLLIASLIDDSLSFSQNMSATTDITNLIAEQSKFSADVQSQLTEAINQTSGTLTQAQKDAEVILSESLSVFSTKTGQTLIKSQPVVPKALIIEKSEPAPKAAVKAAPKAVVKAAPKAVVKAAPKAVVKAAPKAVVKAAPKAAVKAAPKAVVKAAPKAVVEAAPKAVAKAAPKAVVKAAPKAVVEAAPKAVAKAVPKAEVKAVPTAEVKAVPTAEVKAVPTAEVKAAPKAEVEAAPKK
jgi:phasin family protein